MFCPACGAATGNANYASNGYNNREPQSNTSSGLSVASTVLGAIGIILAWLIALLGYIFGGAGLALALVARGKAGESKLWVAGLTLSIITLSFALINSILGVLIVLS